MKIKIFFQKFYKELLLLISIFFSTQSFAAPPGNRIDRPIGNGQCLVSNNFNEAFCQEERKFALEINCINQNEFNSLVNYRAFPVCNRRNQLVTWCPCYNNKINIDLNFENYDFENFDIK